MPSGLSLDVRFAEFKAYSTKMDGPESTIFRDDVSSSISSFVSWFEQTCFASWLKFSVGQPRPSITTCRSETPQDGYEHDWPYCMLSYVFGKVPDKER